MACADGVPAGIGLEAICDATDIAAIRVRDRSICAREVAWSCVAFLLVHGFVCVAGEGLGYMESGSMWLFPLIRQQKSQQMMLGRKLIGPISARQLASYGINV